MAKKRRGAARQAMRLRTSWQTRSRASGEAISVI